MDVEQINELQWISEVKLDISKFVIKTSNKKELIKTLDFFESHGFGYTPFCTRKFLIEDYRKEEYIFINQENNNIDMVGKRIYFTQPTQVDKDWLIVNFDEMPL